MTDWFARPIFCVTDVEASIRFYVDQLGFTNPWRFDEGGKVFVAQVERQGCAIILSSQWPDKAGKAMLFISLNVEPPTIEAATAALDNLRAELEAKGAPVKEGGGATASSSSTTPTATSSSSTIRTRPQPARSNIATNDLIGGCMASVTGFGGTFLRANDPKALYQWYEQHLGLVNAHGAFTYPAPTRYPHVVFAFFKQEDGYFPPSQKAMINLQVDDLDAVLDRLTAAGIAVDPKRETYDFGKFGWLTDPEGNRVELWQPLGD